MTGQPTDRDDRPKVDPPLRPWRIGVTGHRMLPRDDRLREQVRAAIQLALAAAPQAAPAMARVHILSPLAEGADRLVVQEALSQTNAKLEVILPLPPEEYRRDFSSQSSRDEFDILLKQSVAVSLAPRQATRAAAYEAAGRAIVDQSNVLIAVWNGRPSGGQGGTAEIVAYAQQRQVPIFWIRSDPPFNLTEC